MLDSRASVNVIPLSVMRQLGLEAHPPYRNVCGLDSKAMPIHGFIKNMVVYLVTSPDISTIIDVLVVDLSPPYGILLSRKFLSSLGGTLQMDLTFTSIPNPEGRLVKVWGEPKKPMHVEMFLKHGNKVGKVAQVYHVSDAGEDEMDSLVDFGFNKIFDEINDEYPTQLEPSISSETDYVDALEDIDDSQDNKGKAPMFTASHAIQEQGSSSEAKLHDNFRALPPLPLNDNQESFPTTN